jgi:hypothetical protein
MAYCPRRKEAVGIGSAAGAGRILRTREITRRRHACTGLASRGMPALISEGTHEGRAVQAMMRPPREPCCHLRRVVSQRPLPCRPPYRLRRLPIVVGSWGNVSHDRVCTVTAVDPILGPIGVEGVVGPMVQRIATGPAVDRVRAQPTMDRVIPRVAVEDIGCGDPCHAMAPSLVEPLVPILYMVIIRHAVRIHRVVMVQVNKITRTVRVVALGV